MKTSKNQANNYIKAFPSQLDMQRDDAMFNGVLSNSQSFLLK